MPMMKSMKPNAEMIEGPEAYTRFRNVMKSVLAVPHSVIQKRIEEQRRQSALNPSSTGPKRKVKLKPSMYTIVRGEGGVIVGAVI
jgi:hypothetical protein